MTDALAHLDPSGRKQSLHDHLDAVADLAAGFAEAFASAPWGRLAGLWHDLGKIDPQFLKRLAGEKIRVDHKGAGAFHAWDRGKNGPGIPLALVMFGHHGGLPDLGPTNWVGGVREKERVARPLLAAARKAGLLGDDALPDLPDFVMRGARSKDYRPMEFWTRMLFSALVDADFLDTERFFHPEKADARGHAPTPAAMKEQLDTFLDQKTREAEATPINALRAEVLAACRTAADLPPGVFTLTVPTGGGKTLASMAFALDHAIHHGMDRVIVVIPYTSIIEQNAEVFRKAFGSAAVIEHHSALDSEKIDPEERLPAELAAENWNAPLVVTTSVQFFESLFGSKPSVCRKLHNVARSVVVLDEVQTLPAKLLAPILDGLATLARDYGTTVVLCTATQPALTGDGDLAPGVPRLSGAREIFPDPKRLFDRTAGRVRVTWPSDPAARLPWDELAARLAKEEQVLAVVHKRADARDLVRRLDALLGDDTTIHLSASMCAAHRLGVIERIKAALKAGEPLRVVSTQLVEAGVDLDFPVVYRALGGVDSIAQAAGRCNREGRLAEGRVEVFVAESAPPRGIPQRGLEVARSLLVGRGPLDLSDPAIYREYFERLYRVTDTNSKFIQEDRAKLAFRTVAEHFRMIEDDWRRAVVVPYGPAPAILKDLDERLRRGVPIRWRDELRRLQRYTVQTSAELVDAWLTRRTVRVVGDDMTLAVAFRAEVLYEGRFGLSDEEGSLSLCTV
jgi:CRISPR-associated endonuclease/helicase Cas3